MGHQVNALEVERQIGEDFDEALQAADAARVMYTPGWANNVRATWGQTLRRLLRDAEGESTEELASLLSAGQHGEPVKLDGFISRLRDGYTEAHTDAAVALEARHLADAGGVEPAGGWAQSARPIWDAAQGRAQARHERRRSKTEMKKP